MTIFNIPLGELNLVENKDGERLTAAALTIIKQLLAMSATRTLTMSLDLENQQKFAEEIGYRRALLEFASYFETPQET